MGVRGLQTLMDNNPNIASLVNIKDIVEIHKRETGRDAVMVVDGCSCLRPLYGTLDWVCGGQIREYVEVFKNFIKAFVDLGVKLVFFFDGPTLPRKRKVWIQRRIKSLKDVYKTYDLIGSGVHPSQIDKSILMLPPANAYLARFAVQTSGCELYTSINECDEEVAQYAKLHNCFAIFGQDSDYAIYDGPKYYLSASHFNIEKMTTINYNRWALARELRICPGLLPLLASLVGNDIVPSDDLLNFHKILCHHKRSGRPYQRDIIYNVAHFIRDHIDERRLYQSLPLMSRKVFGNQQKATQLHLSVRSYCINCDEVPRQKKCNIDFLSPNPRKHWKNLQKYAEMRVKNGNIDTMVYAVMHGLPYESSTAMEDFRRPEIPPSGAVYLKLRQHVYGIILHEKPGVEAKLVKEWCMQGERSLAEVAVTPVISPKPGTHPGLMALWNENDQRPETLNRKWILLTQSVSDKLDPDKIKHVPATLVAPTLLLFYLSKEVDKAFLEEWEIEAFVGTAVMLPSYTTESLSAIDIPKAIPRAVHLACVFVRGVSIIKMLMDACGRPVPHAEVSAWYFFDGKLFQTMYKKCQKGSKIIDLCNKQVAQLEQFNIIRSILFD